LTLFCRVATPVLGKIPNAANTLALVLFLSVDWISSCSSFRTCSDLSLLSFMLFYSFFRHLILRSFILNCTGIKKQGKRLIEAFAGVEIGTSTSFGLSMLMFISFEKAEYSKFSFIFYR
jgi:hypothetical protein